MAVTLETLRYPHIHRNFNEQLKTKEWQNNLVSVREQIHASFIHQPDDITLFSTYARVGKAFQDYYLPISKTGIRPREYAFIVHPRDPIENDIKRQFPALSSEYMSYESMSKIFESLPPMILGEFNGLQSTDGKRVDGWLVSAPITAGGLYTTRSLEALDKAKLKVIDTARFAHDNLGVKLIGLGETLGSLSKFGRKIEEQVEGLQVTTGHGYTVHLVGETLKKGAEAVNIEMKNSTLAVVGAAGAIGSSSARLLSEHVGNILLLDEKSKTFEMERIANELDTPTSVITDKSDLRKADLIIVATSNPFPFITSEFVKPGTVIVDDSQPVNMTAKAAKDAGVLLLHPIAQVPEGVERTFDFSLPAGSDFSCAAEVMALAGTGEYHKRTIGRLAGIEQVHSIAALTRKVGIEPAPLQSFGKYIADDYLNKIRTINSSTHPLR